jgi:hypothetical protein
MAEDLDSDKPNMSKPVFYQQKTTATSKGQLLQRYVHNYAVITYYAGISSRAQQS